ncbi:hypothetical protein LOTGIDRAFT_208403 [Lottia gigantea]|uniref:Uncharacterized protein n=1 Tax=Lottia gigantea TaxID=225164 RepID=V4B4H3_LOTGI|nr:hypothetical protein LOTGIDRAFT_208403 [Lottia gigantea]ESP05368.1 hypothetical protein LOTGIDRAFT_208403 [Lottia gigantea]
MPTIKQNLKNIHVEAEFLEEDVEQIESLDDDDDNGDEWADLEEASDLSDDDGVWQDVDQSTEILDDGDKDSADTTLNESFEDSDEDGSDDKDEGDLTKPLYKKPVLNALKKKLHQAQLSKGITSTSVVQPNSRSRSRKNKHPPIIPKEDQPDFNSDFIAFNPNKPMKKPKKDKDVFSKISMKDVSVEKEKLIDLKSKSGVKTSDTKTKNETKKTASGKMIVTSNNEVGTSSGSQIIPEPAEVFEVDKKCARKVQTTQPSIKQQKKSPCQKRKHQQDQDTEEEPSPKLTSKQRRRREKADKQNKIGVHYYLSANVKNRSNRRRQ